MTNKELTEVIQHFSRIGNKWEAKDPGNRYHYYWHDKKFIDFCQIKTKQKVLDVGSGIATLAIEAYNHGAESHALDITPEMVAAGKENAKKKHAKVTFHIGNAEKNDLPSDYFDKIISSGVPEHTPNPKAFIKEMHRILKKGGELNLQVMGEKNPLTKVYLRINRDNFRLKNLRGKEYYLKLLQEEGFKIEKVYGSTFLALPYSKFPGKMGLAIAKLHIFIEENLLEPIFNYTNMNSWAYSFFIKARKK